MAQWEVVQLEWNPSPLLSRWVQFLKEIPKMIIIDIAAADTVREVVENAQSTFTFIFIFGLQDESVR